jgi:hypothetical protein
LVVELNVVEEIHAIAMQSCQGVIVVIVFHKGH